MAKLKESDWRLVLRELGLRATPARMAVCKLLSGANGPLTHAEVAKRLESRGIDRTTVFRNLNDLVEGGLVRRLEVGDHVYRFEWRARNADKRDHPHFVCVDCGEVRCLPDVALAAIPASRQRTHQILDVTEVLYKGHCASCVG